MKCVQKRVVDALERACAATRFVETVAWLAPRIPALPALPTRRVRAVPVASDGDLRCRAARASRSAPLERPAASLAPGASAPSDPHHRDHQIALPRSPARRPGTGALCTRRPGVPAGHGE